MQPLSWCPLSPSLSRCLPLSSFSLLVLFCTTWLQFKFVLLCLSRIILSLYYILCHSLCMLIFPFSTLCPNSVLCYKTWLQYRVVPMSLSRSPFHYMLISFSLTHCLYITFSLSPLSRYFVCIIQLGCNINSFFSLAQSPFLYMPLSFSLSYRLYVSHYSVQFLF